MCPAHDAWARARQRSEGGRGGRELDEALAGGLVGRGLMATVVEAYQFLAFNYTPGDEIYLFGFSRGAFTARTLTHNVLDKTSQAQTNKQAHHAHQQLCIRRCLWR